MSIEEMKKYCLTELSARMKLIQGMTSYKAVRAQCNDLCVAAGLMKKLGLISERIHNDQIEKAIQIAKEAIEKCPGTDQSNQDTKINIQDNSTIRKGERQCRIRKN